MHFYWLSESFRARFSLMTDKASNAEIERRIRDGVELRGATPWILMFAILVASIGLNVNSTAVIIGAMLISPLMGPIMGVGHGVAVYDFALVRRSFWNLAIATLISLTVSSLYFLVTPLSDAQSELLARTSPTLWDVLIALFGGLAGIVGATREERSHVVPGVAIATALMPPLCTAGYGLATGQWAYFGGAFYLYAINCVFIGVATILGIRALRFPYHNFVEKGMERRVRLVLLVVAAATSLPAAYLGANLVRDQLYKGRALEFVRREFVFPNVYVASAKVDVHARRVEVSLIGDPVDRARLDEVEARMQRDGMEGTQLAVHQASENDKLDVTALRTSLLGDLYRDSREALRQKDAELEQLRKELAQRDGMRNMADDLAQEIRAQVPSAGVVVVAEGLRKDRDSTKPALVVHIASSAPVDDESRTRLRAWLQVRTKADPVLLQVEEPPPPPPQRGQKKR
ncbi:DUF389 domain-containing protein [Candidatus Symbiobacter mobilis]|uniref:TIGR00341 family protein n=1 Tax=Candidatus Symbiobacter mobilis CR TaxID=946483 RepID=U5N684_9BURK|nr:DUF389 domain-containing protein [Candidatus Symbiobacter mobilis]AGX86810.1 hypothetical protein Cenrod_0703 [Candidatus Symbiobacter mobilis CR]